MNKDRFHNALAMALGYEQIVNDKRYNIIVDDNADDPKVVIEDTNGYTILIFKVSELEKIKQNGIHLSNGLVIEKDMDVIIDAVHQAYMQAKGKRF